MIIFTDTREQKNKHILDYFDKVGISHSRQTVNAGDYFNPGNPLVAVERKANLQEVCGNLCQGKARFYREFDRAKAAGVKLTLLIEQGNIRQLSDVAKWQNPRLRDSPCAVTGRELMERLYKLKVTFGIDILFCSKKDTGAMLIKLLGGSYE